MIKKRIYVGLEYKDAFDSICSLIKGGCLDGLNYSVSNGIISDGLYEYELMLTSNNRESDLKIGFDKNGATWFKALRGEAVENDDSIWATFIENVGIEYHKRYSFVEFKQQPKSNKEKAMLYSKCSVFASNFVNTFYPQFVNKIDVKQVDDESIIDDVYGVSMRVELSGGTGASLPILGKLYFSGEEGVIKPIETVLASHIDETLSNIIPDDAKAESLALPSDLVDITLTAIDKIVTSQEENLADYLCVTNEDDRYAINGLIDKLSHENLEVECQRLDILYISHVKLQNYACDVYSRGSKLFRLIVNSDNSITVYCLTCNDSSPLVFRNSIDYFNEQGEPISVTLDDTLPNFGLSEFDLDEVKNFSSIGSHFIEVDCSNSGTIATCHTYKCKSQLFEVTIKGKSVYKCLDCGRPEVVYTDYKGDKYYTPHLVYVTDKKAMMPLSEDLYRCSVCGRYYTKTSKNARLCPLCSRVFGLPSRSDFALYKYYKSMLSLSTRFFRGASKKACFEDDELIIFKVGRAIFAFNKLNVKDVGYIKAPKKMRISKNDINGGNR